ncbi:MAG: CRISPR-associated endonuclease Cas1 [Betaproteobacteria bacterium]|nr:CRISPR-associated endonuclease Cas1 [Betaproteobacteria bacterium]
MGHLQLWIDEPGASLDLVSGAARIRLASGEMRQVGVGALAQVTLLRPATLSTDLLRACHENGVAVALLSERSPNAAFLWPASPRGARLRHAQHRVADDAAHNLDLARWLVAEKIREQMRWLTAQDVEHHLERFRLAALATSQIDTLRGIEGASSARYFRLWAGLWQAPWQFPGRDRLPPGDPVNALLSLTYTLALAMTGRLAGARGLDLAVGSLHPLTGDRPALAMDLMEPLRPWCDQWVWQICESGKVTPQDFELDPERGCRLTRDGRRKYYAAWFADQRRWFEPQARRGLAGWLRQLRVRPEGLPD